MIPALRPSRRVLFSTTSRIIYTNNISISSTRHRHNRLFSCTVAPQLRTSELTPTQLSSLKANDDRLWDAIHSTAQWGTGKRYGDQPEQTGLSRLTLSDSDKQARDWFVKTTQSLSCKTHVDAVGNIFAIRPGLTNDAPATFAGSHLDSQPTGGRFDGVLGVMAGVEMLRVLEENWIETEGPVGVVNWTNEEGARYSRSMMGSGVWAGAMDLQTIYDLKEVGMPDGGPKSVKDELQRIGYLGDIPASYKDGVKLGAHFELHIEQGPHLVRADEKVGVVKGVQAYNWFTITLTGRDCHTGTTSFEDRADALHYASKIIWEVRGIAEKVGGLASVGIINAYPGSVNTVPGLVSMSLDVRHPEDDKCKEIVSSIQNFITNLAASTTGQRSPEIKIEMKEDFASKAVLFDPSAIACVEESAKTVLENQNDARQMASGAGHDSVFTNRHCPTAMIFIPCKNGVSHHPEEWSEKGDCAIGASVLMQSVVRYDRLRYEKGEFA